MKKILALALSGLLLTSGAAFASNQDYESYHDKKEKVESSTAEYKESSKEEKYKQGYKKTYKEDRQQMKQKKIEKWNSLSDEEKAKWKEKKKQYGKE